MYIQLETTITHTDTHALCLYALLFTLYSVHFALLVSMHLVIVQTHLPSAMPATPSHKLLKMKLSVKRKQTVYIKKDVSYIIP